MSSTSPTLDELKQLIIESLQLEGMTPDQIGDEDALFGEGLGLDSVDALEMVVAMEQQFKVKIDSESIDANAFKSVSTMHTFIHEQIVTARSAS